LVEPPAGLTLAGALHLVPGNSPLSVDRIVIFRKP